MEPCPVCKTHIEEPARAADRDANSVECVRCGHYYIGRNVIQKLRSIKANTRQSANISGYLRENQGFEIDSSNINQLLLIKTPSFHERADKLLLMLERITSYAGEEIGEDSSWISYSWCIHDKELQELIDYLESQSWIKKILVIGSLTVKILPDGWARLEELRRINPNSHQCFVAMWFTPEMNKLFEDIIKPAIEFKEEGAKESRYKAVKIDNVEHTNDINDEIIAQIRRSRFMVCDLTGYRGGVYFEAGFAYGLGIEVIYTCRQDWTKEETLKDSEGKEVTSLLDRNGKPVAVKKEGVHFDLAHRNRIEWEPDKLDEFKIKLENRIKAVIV